jgi:hypothetical protein
MFSHGGLSKSRCIKPEKFKIFTAISVHVVVFWVLTSCNDVVGCQRFEGPCCLHLQGEDKGTKVLRNDCILPHHYTEPQPPKKLISVYLMLHVWFTIVCAKLSCRKQLGVL